MARMRKIYKKYERHILLGLVIILLATFSITGAMQCRNRAQGGKTLELGGSFNPTPAKRVEIDDEEFQRLYARYHDFQRAVSMPSREYREHVLGQGAWDSFGAAWAHIMSLAAAEEVGYRAGEHQVHTAAQDMVALALYWRARMPLDDVNYQQFLKDNYYGRPDQFEETVREVVVKDQFLYPLISCARYQVPYAEAYEAWKHTRERVDLRYVALPAAPFESVVRLEEQSRRQIDRQDLLLDKVSAAAAQVRRVWAKLESLGAGGPGPDGKPGTQDDEPGAYPESLDALGQGAAPFKVAPDPWGQPLDYAVVEGGFRLRSAGPDEALDTPDDISIETQRLLDSHARLFELADKLVQRHEIQKAWPATLDALLKGSGSDRLPSLPQMIKDGWEHDFVYTPGGEDAAPTLTCAGPDGEIGGGDDIPLRLDPAGVQVRPGPGLAPYVLSDAKDAWGRSLDVVLEKPQPPTWRVVSAGADGDTGTDDDLDTGNEPELRSFFKTVQTDFTLEARRRFETLYVHLPLVSDQALERLWAKYVDQRPTDEEQLYEYWQSYRGPAYFYQAEDPADPETGHGAELARRVAPDAPACLVPSRDLFPARLGAQEGREDDGGKDDEDGDEGNEADEPKEDEGSQPADDEEAPAHDDNPRRIYAEKGWREIVIREQFVENVLNHLLTRCRESRDAVAKARTARARWQQTREAWERAVKAWEEANAGKPEEERAPKPVEPTAAEPQIPAEVTFESLLQGELAECLGDAVSAVRYYKTPEPLTRKELEANEEFGDELQYTLDRLKADGDYNSIPAQMHRRLTKALVRRLEFVPSRQQTYEEVEAEVFERYLESRQMDRAVKELQKLQDEVLAAENEAPSASEGEDGADDDGAARAEAWTKALEAFRARVGDVYGVDTTGLFLGDTPPPPVEITDEMQDEEARRAARRNFVWRTGYAAVKKSPAPQDTVEPKPGTFGRRILRDPVVQGLEPESDDGASRPEDRGTGCAYLVRVKERVFPSKAEFSPRRYVQHLTREVFGPRTGTRFPGGLKDRPGSFFKALSNFLENTQWMQDVFDLRTHSEIDVLEKRLKK